MREKLQKIDYKILVLIILVLPMEQMVQIKQINMNITKTKSNTFLLDNTPPTCTITNNNNKLTIEAFDSNSMLSSKPFSWDNKNYQESNTLEIGSEKEYEAFVKDNVGNIGSCKIAISTLVSVPNTKLIINRNLYIV